jgi:periplasmic protein CpxP/Spy
MNSRFLQGVSAAALALAFAAGPSFAQGTSTTMPPSSGTTASGATGGAPAATSGQTGTAQGQGQGQPGARVGNNPAAATAPAQMSGAGPVTGGTAPAPGAQNGRMEGRVDQRITQLHRQLRITQAQEQQWSAFANVMRTNAQQMDQLWQQQMANTSSMTAPQSMQAYAALASAHAQQVQQLVPAFQSLYDTLSPEQKQIADKAFSPREGRPTAARGKAGRAGRGGRNGENGENGANGNTSG